MPAAGRNVRDLRTADTMARMRNPATCILLLLILALAACASTPPRNPLAQWRGSPNFDVRRPVAIVLHHTQMDSAESALHTLQTRNSEGPVSSHYLIGDDGALYQLVSEDARAWHAGASRWAGLRDLNSASIGIELDNDGASPFTKPQIATLLRLLQDITSRLQIPRHMVLAHGDIAPDRKVDPSVWFPWQQLAEAGFGLWPREPLPPEPPGFDRWAALRLIGYDLRDPAAAVRAFHRRYRGSEQDQWLPGDEAILHDLQRQLMQLPEAPAIGPTALIRKEGLRASPRRVRLSTPHDFSWFAEPTAAPIEATTKSNSAYTVPRGRLMGSARRAAASSPAGETR